MMFVHIQNGLVEHGGLIDDLFILNLQNRTYYYFFKKGFFFSFSNYLAIENHRLLVAKRFYSFTLNSADSPNRFDR